MRQYQYGIIRFHVDIINDLGGMTRCNLQFSYDDKICSWIMSKEAERNPNDKTKEKRDDKAEG